MRPSTLRNFENVTFAPCGETIEYQTGELRAEPVLHGALLSGRARSWTRPERGRNLSFPPTPPTNKVSKDGLAGGTDAPPIRQEE